MTARHRLVAALAGLALAFGHGLAASHQVAHGDLVLAHPYVQVDPDCAGGAPRAHVMLIINRGPKPDRLIAARLDPAGEGKLVRWSAVDGKATRQVLADGIEIPAKGEVALMAPDLALEFPKSRSALVQGGAAKGSLTFQRSGKVPVVFLVDAPHEGPGRSACNVVASRAPHNH